MTTIQDHPPKSRPARVERSLDEDYATLREAAALLDLSDVGLVRVRGLDGHELVQNLFTRDIEFLTPERSITGLLLTEEGEAVDVVSCFLDDEGIVLRTSFGAGGLVAEHLASRAPSGIQVEELDDALLGVEGPYSWSAVGDVLDPDIASLPFESVINLDWGAHEIVFSRTGFTGEYGYQISGSQTAIAELRSALVETAVPVGREAVEAAMLEVRQPLLSRELADGADPLTAGLQWLIDITKEDFCGRDAVMARFGQAAQRCTVGGMAPTSRSDLGGAAVTAGGTEIGSVVWAVPAPGRDATLVLARVTSELAASGLPLGITAEGGELEFNTMSSPYVIPTSWGVPIL